MRMLRPLALTALLIVVAFGTNAQFTPARSGSVRDRFKDPKRVTDDIALSSSGSAVDPSLAPASGIVDKQQLLLPPKAAKEFDRSMKAFSNGDYRSAADHLEKAAKIAPDYAQAHNNLGAVYLNLQEYDRAVSEFEKTIALRPDLESPHRNLALAMIFLNRLPEAEASARRALELSPSQTVPRFILGHVLLLEGQNTPEAVALLTQASADSPVARLSLAKILQNRGEIDGAIAQLRTYLQTPEPGKKERVEAWIKQLTQRSNTPESSGRSAPNAALAP